MLDFNCSIEVIRPVASWGVAVAVWAVVTETTPAARMAAAPTTVLRVSMNPPDADGK
jgi:hypothetical protein